MCCVSRCVDKHTGSGCIVCEGYVQNSTDGMVPWNINLAMCKCEVCICNCGLYFPLSKWQEVELMREEENNRKLDESTNKKSKLATGQTSKSMFFTVVLF